MAITERVVTARPWSQHILSEARRLIGAGWLADGKHVVAAGMRGEWELWDVASRRADHSRHLVAINRRTGESQCTHCEGHRSSGGCTHALLAFCMNGAVWECVMGFVVDEAAS